MFKRIAIFKVLFLFQICKGGNINSAITFGTHFIFGSQLQSINLSLDGNLALHESAFGFKNGSSVFINGSCSYEVYRTKFGVKNYGSGINYSVKGILGWGNGLNLAGSLISTTSNNFFYDQSHPTSFNGFGIGVDVNLQFGTLKKFSNKRGNFLGLFSQKQTMIHFNFSNDFKSGFFRGKGGDMGETGSLMLKIAQLQSNYIDIYGVGLALFTPEPDYSKNPTQQKNSDDESAIVLPSTTPFENLYHGNIFGSFSRTSNYYSIALKLGVDSKKTGANIQNWLHDTFGLYPRFEWPVDEKNKLLFECATGVLKKVQSIN